jgi:hypothetical protein
MSAFVSGPRRIPPSILERFKTFWRLNALGCFLVEASYKQVRMFIETLLLGGIFIVGAPETLSGEG